MLQDQFNSPVVDFDAGAFSTHTKAFYSCNFPYLIFYNLRQYKCCSLFRINFLGLWAVH